MKKRIMVVDDSHITELQIQGLLADTEFEVVAHCENGEEAIARYGEVRPDIVTMDIIMPGIDGLEAAQVLLNEHPDAKILMLSSLVYDDTIEEASNIGTKGFLCKPLSRDGLIEALEKILNNG